MVKWYAQQKRHRDQQRCHGRGQQRRPSFLLTSSKGVRKGIKLSCTPREVAASLHRTRTAAGADPHKGYVKLSGLDLSPTEVVLVCAHPKRVFHVCVPVSIGSAKQPRQPPSELQRR
eukprot:GHVU01124231.1.p2 GENE.GHVU01124231.1~~GHVU01124231.1.p2  ORF type:complete len:117 (-),score=10.37 GHVU01124231.1:121-471(-)